MKAIVLTNSNWGIANQGKQPIYIKEDLRRFNELTRGQFVIFGRKTLETFPNGAPLRNRINVCISHTAKTQDGMIVVPGVDWVDIYTDIQKVAFCIGGASIYKQLYCYFTDVYQTEVLNPRFKADLFFPPLDQDSAWHILSEDRHTTEEGYDICYRHWKKGTDKGIDYVGETESEGGNDL